MWGKYWTLSFNPLFFVLGPLTSANFRLRGVPTSRPNAAKRNVPLCEKQQLVAHEPCAADNYLSPLTQCATPINSPGSQGDISRAPPCLVRSAVDRTLATRS